MTSLATKNPQEDPDTQQKHPQSLQPFPTCTGPGIPKSLPDPHFPTSQEGVESLCTNFFAYSQKLDVLGGGHMFNNVQDELSCSSWSLFLSSF